MFTRTDRPTPWVSSGLAQHHTRYIRSEQRAGRPSLPVMNPPTAHCDTVQSSKVRPSRQFLQRENTSGPNKPPAQRFEQGSNPRTQEPILANPSPPGHVGLISGADSTDLGASKCRLRSGNRKPRTSTRRYPRECAPSSTGIRSGPAPLW
eukprot:1561107-Rhodomonas_salina.4